MNGEDKHNEWYFQSDYDLETAKDMLKSGRNVYCIFMCHLSVEKALKGLFVKTTKQYPPKTHNLTFFIDKIGLKPETEDFAFLHSLNKVSIPTTPYTTGLFYPTFVKDNKHSLLVALSTGLISP